MKIFNFFDALNNKSFFNSSSCMSVFFHTKEYPLVFIQQVHELLQKQQPLVEVINVDDVDYSAVRNKLETSFLGHTITYVLKKAGSLDTSKQKKLESYISSYSGPHNIVYWGSKALKIKRENQINIEIPEVVTRINFHQFALHSYGIGRKKIALLEKDIFDKHKQITLEKACMVIRYFQLIGNNYKEFSASWIDLLIKPDQSLFTLSQYFFAKKPSHFFKMLLTIKDHYSIHFWVMFWSEQMWRAYFYVSLSQQNKFAQAKEISYRLPFSFMQRDWKKITTSELLQAHNFLYALDFSLKNGGKEFSLELFYNKFLLSKF